MIADADAREVGPSPSCVDALTLTNKAEARLGIADTDAKEFAPRV